MNNKVAVTLQRWEIAEEGNRIGSELDSEKMIFFHYKTTSTLSMWINQKNGFPFYYEYRWQRLRESIKGEKAKIGRLFVSLFFCNLIAGFLMCMPHTFFYLSEIFFLSFYKISFAVERYEISPFFSPYRTSKVSLSLVSKFNPPELPNCFFSLLAILGLIVSQCYDLRDLWDMHLFLSFHIHCHLSHIISHYSYVLCGFQQLIIVY